MYSKHFAFSLSLSFSITIFSFYAEITCCNGFKNTLEKIDWSHSKSMLWNSLKSLLIDFFLRAAWIYRKRTQIEWNKMPKKTTNGPKTKTEALTNSQKSCFNRIFPCTVCTCIKVYGRDSAKRFSLKSLVIQSEFCSLKKYVRDSKTFVRLR